MWPSPSFLFSPSLVLGRSRREGRLPLPPCARVEWTSDCKVKFCFGHVYLLNYVWHSNTAFGGLSFAIRYVFCAAIKEWFVFYIFCRQRLRNLKAWICFVGHVIGDTWCIGCTPGSKTPWEGWLYYVILYADFRTWNVGSYRVLSPCVWAD
jgi:hypothetical protein